MNAIKVEHAPKLAVVLGDAQIPYHDKSLHTLTCRWLQDHNPDTLVILGDFLDFPSMSTHPKRNDFSASVSEVLNSGKAVLSNYLEVTPTLTAKYFICGNHEDRIRRQVMDKLPDLYDSVDTSIDTMLGLSAAGFTVFENYPHDSFALTPKLAIRHGWIARQNAGVSALKTLDVLGHSVIVGHTHRQAIVHRSHHNIDGSVTTLTAVENGTMATIRNGLGYSAAADWQNGFSVVRFYADGEYHVSQASYSNGVLYYEGERYSI